MEVELNEPDYERQYSAAAICVRVSRAMAMLDIGKTKLYELIEAGELETIRWVGAR